MFDENDSVKVSFNKKNLNIHFENSYLFHKKESIIAAIDTITKEQDFEEMKNLGFTRTRQSMINEWIAHNFLYYKGYQRNRTKSVDLNEGEPKWKRFIYWILAKLYQDPLK